MKDSVLAGILSAFTSPQIHVNDLPTDSPDAVVARRCERLFTEGVDTLRSHFPTPCVRMIARLVWELVGSRQVAIAVSQDVPSISFASIVQRGVERGMVLLPYRWPQMTKDDAIMQLGAILNVGVQVVDFCNDRLHDERAASFARCLAYEAEMLRMIQTMQPEWKPNDYQKMALSKYPEGIRSAGVELYEPRSTAPKGSA